MRKLVFYIILSILVAIGFYASEHGFNGNKTYAPWIVGFLIAASNVMGYVEGLLPEES